MTHTDFHEAVLAEVLRINRGTIYQATIRLNVEHLQVFVVEPGVILRYEANINYSRGFPDATGSMQECIETLKMYV